MLHLLNIYYIKRTYQSKQLLIPDVTENNKLPCHTTLYIVIEFDTQKLCIPTICWSPLFPIHCVKW